MRDSIERRLLPAGSTRFKRWARIVHPHIDAAIKEFGYVEVIILNECDPATHVVFACKLVDALNQVSPRSIRRMCLPRKDNLQRLPFVVQNSLRRSMSWKIRRARL